MQTQGIHAIQLIAVAFSMIIGFWFYQRFQPEILMKTEGEVITAADISANPIGNYSGKTAGEGIPHLSGKEDFEELGSSDYVTVTTKEIIHTNIYGLKSWVNPTSLTRRRMSGGRTVSTGKRAPKVRKGPGVRAEAYQEYYLIRLADSTYCFARLSAAYVWRLKKEEEITLPMGKKQATSPEERNYLAEAGERYGADTSYLLYMVDEEGEEKKEFTFFLIRFGAAAGVCFVLAVGLMLLMGKIFPPKEEQGR